MRSGSADRRLAARLGAQQGDCVVRSWVLVVGAGAEHVPDGGEDCSFDRDDGSEFSAAGGDASWSAPRFPDG